MRIITHNPDRHSGMEPCHAPGFALLIAIVLMAFIMLLLISLATLTQVENQAALNRKNMAQARQNALLGLQVALGQLQHLAGPDQRVTATADLVATTDKSGTATNAAAGISVQDGTRYWTGVWGNARSPTAVASQSQLLNWLVSGNERGTVTVNSDGSIEGVSAMPDYLPSASVSSLTEATAQSTHLTINGQPASLLVGPGSVLDPVDYVVAPRVRLPGASGGAMSGGYAYWIGDEGVKARGDLVDSDAVLDTTASEETSRLRYRSPARMGIETMHGFPRDDGVTLDLGADTASALRDALGRTLAPSQFTVATESISMPVDFLRERFHDLGFGSAGVLSNTLSGGLKIDLTHAFRTGSTVADAPTGPMWTVTNPTYGSTEHGPAWQVLRSYYQLSDAVDSAGAITPRGQTLAGQHGVYPVVALFQLFIEARLTSMGGDDYHLELRHYPAVVLWNPYNVTLADTTYVGSYTADGMVFQARVSEDDGSEGSGIPAAPPAFGGVAQVVSPYFHFADNDTVRPEEESNLQFAIESGEMEPGAAYVYSLPADATFTSTDDYKSYTLTRGWHVGGGPKAITVTSDPFALPTSASDYITSVWISGSASGRVPVSAANALPAASAHPGYSVPSNDQLIIRLDDGTSTSGELLQNIMGNSPSLRNNKTTPLHRQPLATGSIGWYAQKWALKATVDRGLLPDSSSTGSDFPIAWLANYNPRSPGFRRPTGGNLATIPSFNRIVDDATRFGKPFDAASNNFGVSLSDPTTGRSFVGMSQNEWADMSDPQVVLFDIPHGEHPVLSVGALQHAQAYLDEGADQPSASNVSPAYPIGNSLASPRIALDATIAVIATNRALFDHSYLLNRALWDTAFFSSVPETGDLPDELPNRLYEPAITDNPILTADDFRQTNTSAAEKLLVKGAFNINSTSVEAWRALLSSANHAPVGTQTFTDANEPSPTPYPRASHPVDDGAILDVSADAGYEASAYRGYRFLTEAQIDVLAEAIVAQVRERGPFVSLSDFVNRSLTTTAQATTDHRMRGALAQALLNADTNDLFLGDGELLTELPTASQMNGVLAPEAHEGLTAQHLPGWVSQADLLQALGPMLSARSDTFVIRVYGDAVNPINPSHVEGQAWCEAVVQRLPDFVDESAPQAAETLTTGLNPVNLNFGRRFELVSFRWLTPDEI